MKKKNLLKLTAYLLSAVILTTPITTKAYTTLDEAIEDTYNDLENKEIIKPGKVVIENEDKALNRKEIIGYNKDLEIGDIVNVLDFGNSRSDGSGVETIVYFNETLAIVGIKSDAEFPYALAKIKEDGTLSDVVGWFKGRNLKSRTVFSSTIDYADVLKTIVDKDSVNLYETTWITDGTCYYELGDDYAIKAEYIFPEPNFNYDYKLTTKYDNNYQYCEFYVDDEIIATGLYNWKTGIVFFRFQGRDKVQETPTTLKRKYNIISS